MAKIAYFLDVFPVVSETFILNEILELKKRGLSIFIYALQRPDRFQYNSVKHAGSGELERETIYIDPFEAVPGRRKALALHLPLFLRNPLRYIRTLVFSRSRDEEMRAVFRAAPVYVRKIMEQGVTHIHAHFVRTACDLSMLISGLTGIPYSFSTHANDIYDRNAKDMTDAIRSAAFAVTCTAYNRDYLIRKYGTSIAAKMRLNYHGVDTDTLGAAGNHASREGDSKNVSVLAVGRLVKKKGLHFLIEAVSQLKASSDTEYTVTVIGDGPEKEYLYNMAKDLDLHDRIFFLGALPFEKIRGFYENADLVVQPCVVAENGDRDGIPNVIFEAMSAGLPVISTTVSGIPEAITDGVDGLLVPPGDSKALAHAMNRLIHDKDLRTVMGSNARKKMVEHFDRKQHIDELLEMFRAVKKG